MAIAKKTTKKIAAKKVAQPSSGGMYYKGGMTGSKRQPNDVPSGAVPSSLGKGAKAAGKATYKKGGIKKSK